MRRNWLAVALLLAAGLGGWPALAQDPCAEDAKRLCPEVAVGSGKLSGCLRKNEPRLSAACRDRLAADAARARTLVQEFARACRLDMEEHCPGVEPGGGRILGCLAQHQPEISPPCQGQLTRFSEARDRVAALRSACTADAATLCQGVPPQVGPLLECLQANEARLSSGCNGAEVRQAAEAASVVDAVEELTRQDRVKEVLEILQGMDSVAFSRSQLQLQYDSYQRLTDKGNATRVLFNPQLVFGSARDWSFQVKVPMMTLYPDPAISAAVGGVQSGLGNVTTALAWNFDNQGQLRQYASLGIQWETSALKPFGAAMTFQPAYALAVRLAKGLSLTTQVAWLRSLDAYQGHPASDLVILEPILVANLPGRSFLALDTKLGWNRLDDSFLPVLKGMAGLFTDQRKALSISAWYQASLSDEAQAQTFKYEVGMSLAYYFDW